MATSLSAFFVEKPTDATKIPMALLDPETTGWSMLK
jgi:hypothetical protein